MSGYQPKRLYKNVRGKIDEKQQGRGVQAMELKC
jgi:hypothetical protein